MRLRHRAVAVVFASGLAVTAAAAPAMAAPVNNQAGLVNVNVQLEDVTVSIPVTVVAALNICDTDINVLSIDLADGTNTTCEALAEAN